MLESQTIEGRWWLPDSADHKVPGTLEFSADRFTLHTHGALHPHDGTTPLALFEPTDVGAIHGTSHDRKTEVTLMECHGFMTTAPADVIGESWQVGKALLGAHLAVDVLFDQVTIETEHLDEWARTPHVSYRPETTAEGLTTAIYLEARQQPLAAAEVPDVGKFEVEAIPSWDWNGRNAELAMQARVRWSPTSPVGADEVLKVIFRVRDLLRLAVGRPCALASAQLRPAVTDERGLRLNVCLLLRTTALMREPPEPARAHEMICTLDQLPGGFTASLPHWWTLRQRYKRAWPLLMRQDDIRVMNPSEAFVARVSAIESLHATDFGGSAAATAEREDRINQVSAAINQALLPEDLVEWAKERLEASTPPIARHRMIELIRSLGAQGDELSGGDPERFAARVVATRNDLTHPPTGPSRRQVLQDEDLFWHGQALYWVGAIYLLRQLGLSEAELAQRLGTNSEYHSIAEKLK